MGMLPRFTLTWRPGRGVNLDVVERQGRAREWLAIPLTGKTKTGRRRKTRKDASFRL